jgi:hypothetical protein
MRALSVTTAMAMAVTAVLSSQQAGQQPPVFRSSVDVIQVDVSLSIAMGARCAD